ncbi:MAG: HmuY family protein [Myxococcota bacterium]|nr:HmuY family protein [Myxococcota bacterium]
MRPVALPALIALVSLGACLPEEPVGPAPETSILTLELDGSSPRFVDITAAAEVQEAEGWDIRIEGWGLFLNGGESGTGRAGGIDMELLDLTMDFEDLHRKNQVLYFFFYDAYACALSDWWWYALDGTHTLFSNYHTYIVRRGDRDFALQWLDYYQVIDGAAAAGYPQFRWAELPPDGSTPLISVDELDATAGGLGSAPEDPSNKWTYFSFDNGILDLTDEEAAVDPDWDLGFKRFYVKSNSGPSGPGGVLTTDFDADRGEEPEEVLDFTPDNQLDHFEARMAAWDPSTPTPLAVDAIRPVLDRWVLGLPGSETNPATHDPSRWFLISDRSGEAVAKFRVLSFEGSDAVSPDRITLEWAVLE